MTNRKKELSGVLRSLTSALGFHAGNALQYERLTNESTWLLTFSYRWDGRGYGSFTYGVGIFFEQFDEWLHPKIHGIDVKVATILALPENLREEKRFHEWTFRDWPDLEKLYAPVSEDIKKHAIPFLERYSSLSGFRKILESGVIPREWSCFGEFSRVMALAVFQLLDGNRSQALDTLGRALAQNGTKGGVWHDVEALRKRICESQAVTRFS